MQTWQDELYQKTLDDELRGLQRRLNTAEADAAANLERTLRQLYELEGSDWLGRGEVSSITLNAQIAAYELTIAGLKRLP